MDELTQSLNRYKMLNRARNIQADLIFFILATSLWGWCLFFAHKALSINWCIYP